MRITSEQIHIIKTTVAQLIGPTSRVWLFGSRADDGLRGGDIDLLVETEDSIPNRAQMICQLYGALIMALGDRKLDVLLKDVRTPDAPVFRIAKRNGVLL